MAGEDTFRERVLQWEALLDKVDYYQLLQVEPTASAGKIREAYHRQSHYFHPDRYFHLDDERLKAAIYNVSKRITEAYVVLRDPQKRRAYDQQLRESARTKLRLDEQAEQAGQQQQKQQIARTEKGRQLYQQGMLQLNKQDFVGAERTFKLALAYEPENELFKKLVEQARSNIKVDFKVK